MLALLLCLSCIGCGVSGGDDAQPGAVSVPKNVQRFTSGATIETDFGTVTVLEAAFCGKAQIYYTKSTRSGRTTVNGVTTETYEETIHPGHVSAMDNKLVFALRTVITNTTQEDLEIQKLSAKAQFVNNESVYFSKGGNFHISDEAYKIIPAGSGSEIILAALVPVEQYLMASECVLEIGGTKLAFDYDDIGIYNTLGYQEGDNTTVPIYEVIQAASGSVAHTPAATEAATEPQAEEPKIDMAPGIYTKSGGNIAEGRAVILENVSLGFRDQLPGHVLKKFDRNADKLTLNDSQLYAVVQFTVTNQTTDTVDIADLHDDFLVQMNYNDGFLYSTDSDVYCVYESGANMKMLRSSSSSGSDISVSPLASADVTLYLPCAKQAAVDTESPLKITFVSKYSGNESFDFTFAGRSYQPFSGNGSRKENSENLLVDSSVKLVPGRNQKTGENRAEGRALVIENVQLGFQNPLPAHILDNFGRSAENLTLNDSQTYAVIAFTVTNQTTDTVDLADLHDDFLVQLNYNNGFQYSTNTDLYAVYESAGVMKMVRSNASSGHAIAVSPLAKADVVVYIPCSTQVEENPDKPLKVTFVSRYSGNESYEFTFDRKAGFTDALANALRTKDEAAEEPFFWVDGTEGSDVKILDHKAKVLANGDVRFDFEFQAPAGMEIYVLGMSNEEELYCSNTKTTGRKESCSITIRREDLEAQEALFFGCYEEGSNYIYGLLIQKNNLKTDGNPTGDVKSPQYSTNGNFTVHGLTAQLLDNGYVRYTLDFTCEQGYFISFFDPPNGDRFMRVRYRETTGERETLVVDISQEDNNASSEITIKFYNKTDDDGYWVFFAPVRF